MDWWLSLRALLTEILKNPNKTAYFVLKTNLVARCKTYANKMCVAAVVAPLALPCETSMRNAGTQENKIESKTKCFAENEEEDDPCYCYQELPLLTNAEWGSFLDF